MLEPIAQIVCIDNEMFMTCYGLSINDLRRLFAHYCKVSLKVTLNTPEIYNILWYTFLDGDIRRRLQAPQGANDQDLRLNTPHQVRNYIDYLTYRVDWEPVDDAGVLKNYRWRKLFERKEDVLNALETFKQYCAETLTIYQYSEI